MDQFVAGLAPGGASPAPYKGRIVRIDLAEWGAAVLPPYMPVHARTCPYMNVAMPRGGGYPYIR
jgi:hypothetical protein